MDFFFIERVNPLLPRWKMSLIFSLVIHLTAVLLIFLLPQAKNEPVSPFITRLITPDEMKKEFPQEPPVKGSPRRNVAGVKPRELARPILPKAVRPPQATQSPPQPAPRAVPKADEKGIAPDSSPQESAVREYPSQVPRGTAPAVPSSGGPGGREVIGFRKGPAIPAPGPSLREKLFDSEVMGKIAKREEQNHDNGITFDTKEFRYQTYMMRLKERIEGVWKYPPEAAMKGIYGDLIIDFTIKKDGRLGDVEIMRGSGHPDLDKAAMQALKDGELYWPLPVEWGKDELIVHGHFVYTNYGAYIR